MIPVELKLRNFISYGAQSDPIRFDGFNVACLTGDNGNGKSALLDAITWAVWGQARGTDERGAGVDDLIRSGAEDMEVEFTFLLEGNTYRVCRRRDKRRKKSSLEFQVYDGNAFRSITADSISETQRKIIQVLRMDYHTFTSSSFILQGRADSFTSMKPAERKKILGEILGLSVYRDLEMLAREEAGKAGALCAQIDAKLEEMVEELSQMERYRQQEKELEAKYNLLYREYQDVQSEVDSLRSRLSELQQVQKRVQELEAQLKDYQKQITAVEERVKSLRQQLRQGEELVARAGEIESNYRQLQQLVERDKQYNEKSRRLLQLNEEKMNLELQVQHEQSKIEKQCVQLQGELNHYQSLSQQRKGLEKELALLEDGLAGLKQLEERRQELKEAVQSHVQEIKAKELLAARINEQISELRGKYSLLRQPVASCPLCRTELSGVHREQVLNEMIREGQQLKEQHEQLRQEITGLNEKCRQAQDELKQVEDKLNNCRGLEKEYSILQHRLNESKQAAQKQAELQREFDKLQAILNEANFALQQQNAIKDLRQQIRKINYSTAEHNQIQAQIAELKHYEQQYQSLQWARAALESSRENLRHFEESLHSLHGAAGSTTELIQQHSVKLKELTGLQHSLEAAEDKMAGVQKRISEVERSLGIVQEKLDRCRRLEQEKQRLTAERETAQKERNYYNELVKAFGKNGIQAIIIENAIPELEQEANRILQQISEGRLTVALVTQKAAKSSKRVVETLEIYISDESSTRRYEMFSGGEAFKVNFALRIALSRLLARRAGARLQTLVIDEGFGTQDARGKEKLVQAINAIAGDFEKIIVITHIEELKHAFPVQLVVTKGENGSTVEVRQ
ncbi:exonuclease SbcC [Desulfohalotomaculum tongense]|uniref:AAA family ATPase n=1 Tax=Desulforadius tongensis TaxID=1216062 RepID=UPI00195B6544|nr:SMC family ATPase [Desulforadius tongensis]MBM7855290.1 exonuclease SbcC [Desulforadius tongensis]